MDLNTMMGVVERTLDEAGGAVLSTVDADGRPHSRWMTPVQLRGERGSVYCLTLPAMGKVEQIEANGNVSWLLQSRDFSRVITLDGIATIVDNPSLKSSVLEALGPKLATFWKINPDETELVVVETAVRGGTIVDPRSGDVETVTV